jgi:hypothetical protein
MMLSLRSAHIFLKEKEKKESRRSSGGFKRSPVFLKKYYPRCSAGIESSGYRRMLNWKCKGGDFFKNP